MLSGYETHPEKNLSHFKKDGSRCTIEANAYIVFDNGGEPKGVLKVARDVAKRDIILSDHS